MPARAPPTMGRKSTRATHRPHSSGNGTPTSSSVTNTTAPAMSEVRKLPSMYPVTLWLTSAPIRVTVAARSGRIWPRSQRRIFGRLEQQQQDQDEDREQLDEQREAPVADAQGGLAERLGVGDQLGRVLLHPGLDVVLGREVPDPALALLRARDVAGQLVGQVADPVDQRIAERVSQDGEDHQGRRVTIVTARPRRGIHRCSRTTSGLSSSATNPATTISSAMSAAGRSPAPAR